MRHIYSTHTLMGTRGRGDGCYTDVSCGSYGSSVISWVAWHAGSCFSAVYDASTRLGHSNKCSLYVPVIKNHFRPPPPQAPPPPCGMPAAVCLNLKTLVDDLDRPTLDDLDKPTLPPYRQSSTPPLINVFFYLMTLISLHSPITDSHFVHY